MYRIQTIQKNAKKCEHPTSTRQTDLEVFVVMTNDISEWNNISLRSFCGKWNDETLMCRRNLYQFCVTECGILSKRKDSGAFYSFVMQNRKSHAGFLKMKE